MPGTWCVGTDNESISKSLVQTSRDSYREKQYHREEKKQPEIKKKILTNIGCKVSGKHLFIPKYLLKLKEPGVTLPWGSVQLITLPLIAYQDGKLQNMHILNDLSHLQMFRERIKSEAVV